MRRREETVARTLVIANTSPLRWQRKEKKKRKTVQLTLKEVAGGRTEGETTASLEP